MKKYDQLADGVRGLASLNVVIAHYVAAFSPALLHKNYPSVFAENNESGLLFSIASSPALTLLYNGHFAVLIFFVLSGYVLTMPYFNNEPDLLKHRLWGRYLRLNIPIACSIAVSYTLYKLGLYQNTQAAEISGSTTWLGQFFIDVDGGTALKAALYESILFGNDLLNSPLWTLRIEFIGSIYLLLFYSCKPSERILIPFFFVCLLLYLFYQADSIYLIAIFMGSLLNLTKLKKGYALPLLIIGLYLGGFQYQNPIYIFLPEINFYHIEIWDQKTLYNAVGAFLLMIPITAGTGEKILKSDFCQFLGRISYPLYLIHFPILCSLACALYIQFHNNNFLLCINFITYIFVCIIVAMVFSRYIDKSAIKAANISSHFLLKSKKKGRLQQPGKTVPEPRSEVV